MLLCPFVVLLSEKEIKAYDLFYVLFFAMIFTLSPFNFNRACLYMLFIVYIVLLVNIIISAIPFVTKGLGTVKSKLVTKK